MRDACYRKLKKHWKYQLVESFEIDTGIAGHPIHNRFYTLRTGGQLLIRPGYCWDGPSGPTVDTANWMRAALAHDVLYQMVRREELPPGMKKKADDLMKEILEEDGMNRFRRWYSHLGVKFFGGSSAKPGSERQEKITCVAPGGTSTTKRRPAGGRSALVSVVAG